MPPTPWICRRSAAAAGWLSGRSTSATPARRRMRWRPLSSEAERVQLVVVHRGACGEAWCAAVSGAPVDAAADDRGAAGYRAAAGEAPQDLPGRGVQGVRVGAGGGKRSGVDNAVSGADEGGVGGALRVGGLPEDLAGGRVQGGPGAAGDGLPGVRPGPAQGVGVPAKSPSAT